MPLNSFFPFCFLDIYCTSNSASCVVVVYFICAFKLVLSFLTLRSYFLECGFFLSFIYLWKQIDFCGFFMFKGVQCSFKEPCLTAMFFFLLIYKRSTYATCCYVHTAPTCNVEVTKTCSNLYRLLAFYEGICS